MNTRPLLALALAAGLFAAPAVNAAPGADATAPTPPPHNARVVQGDVLEVAAATGPFQTFLRAVRAAGYEETLRGPGPFTIFAPTDEAFSHMSRAERERLMSPRAHEELLALLAYHVVPQRVTTESAHGSVARVQASNGYRLEVDGRDGLRVNDELVVMPDIEARNGVIQGVNSVLSPPVLVASGAQAGR